MIARPGHRAGLAVRRCRPRPIVGAAGADSDHDTIRSRVTTPSNVRRSKGRVFVFDGVMVLAAGRCCRTARTSIINSAWLVSVSQFPLRPESDRNALTQYCSRQYRSGPSGLSGYIARRPAAAPPCQLGGITQQSSKPRSKKSRLFPMLAGARDSGGCFSHFGGNMAKRRKKSEANHPRKFQKRPSRLQGKVLHASWQRCRVHFMRNALAHAGRQGRRVVAAFLVLPPSREPDAT
jgi:hypothetical protein